MTDQNGERIDQAPTRELTQVFNGLHPDRRVHAEHLAHCVALSGLFLNPQPKRMNYITNAAKSCQEKKKIMHSENGQNSHVFTVLFTVELFTFL